MDKNKLIELDNKLFDIQTFIKEHGKEGDNFLFDLYSEISLFRNSINPAITQD